jgi:hypothetical protein
MIGSLESDQHLSKSLFPCTATGRRAFSTRLASVGIYDSSVGSTEVTSSQSTSCRRTEARNNAAEMKARRGRMLTRFKSNRPD